MQEASIDPRPLADNDQKSADVTLTGDLDLHAHGLNVDESTFYESRHTLHSIRVVLFTVSTLYWSVSLYSGGIYGFLSYCRYFTFWGQTMVNIYLFWVILYYPKKRVLSDSTITFQQAILTCETMIVVAFWCLLAPGMGFDKAITYRQVYDHVVPFLFMVHELVVTYGHYTIRGEILGVVIFLIYSCFNILICFAYDLIPYDTPISNPKDWPTYVAIPLSLLFVFFLGRIYTLSKQKIMKKLHLKRIGRMESESDSVFTKLDHEQSHTSSN